MLISNPNELVTTSAPSDIASAISTRPPPTPATIPINVSDSTLPVELTPFIIISEKDSSGSILKGSMPLIASLKLCSEPLTGLPRPSKSIGSIASKLISELG